VRSGVENPLRIAIVTNIQTPYRQKQWECYSKIDGLNITVYYCSKSERNRYWSVLPAGGVREVFLKGVNYRGWHFNPGVFLIPFQKFDLFLVTGYGFPTAAIAIVLLKIFKRNWAMISDGVAPQKLKAEAWYTRAVKRFFTEGATAYFANGTAAKNLLMQFDIAEEKIFNQYLTVDVKYFLENEKASKEKRIRTRHKYGIREDTIVVIYVGRLIPHKGIQDLIQAIEGLVKRKKNNVIALIVGGGEEKERLQSNTKNLQQNVIFTGFVEPYELCLCYYASDIFCLPTHHDPWGLVVNEAMACALPIITTNAAGASVDLVKNNGYVVSAGDVSGLSSAIEALIDADVREAFGTESRRMILNWTYIESSQSFKNMLNYMKMMRHDESDTDFD